jgi:hypothetical protein
LGRASSAKSESELELQAESRKTIAAAMAKANVKRERFTYEHYGCERPPSHARPKVRTEALAR